MEDVGIIKEETLGEVETASSPTREIPPCVQENEMVLMKITFPSDEDLGRAVRAFVGEVALRAGQSERRVHDIRLAISEAVANVFEHAYEGRSDGPVRLTAQLKKEDRLIITVRDWGRKVPKEQIKSRELDDIQEGGLGVFLMNQLADEVHYNTDLEDGTELALTFKLDKTESVEEDHTAEIIQRTDDPKILRSILGMFDLLRDVESPRQMLIGILKNLHSILPFDHAVAYLTGFDELIVDLRGKTSIPFLEDVKYRLLDRVSLLHSIPDDPEDLVYDFSQTDPALLVAPSEDERVEWVDLRPLSVAGEAVGGLALTLRYAPPAEEILEILEAVTKQISVLLEVSRLYQRKRAEGERHLERLSTINEVGEVFSAQATIDRILTLLLELTLGIAGAEVGAIALLERGKESPKLETRIAWGLDESLMDQLTMREGGRLSEVVLKEGAPVIVPSLHDDPVLDLSRLPVFLDSVAAFPLVFKDEQVGVLTLVNAPQDRLRSTADVRTIAIIANLTAAAIVNAWLYQESLAKQRIEQEVRLAGEIQQSLLPREIPERPDIDVAGLSIPAREIGGDYYDLFAIDEDEFGCFIADVSGKGIPASMLTMITRSYLHVGYKQERDPATMLSFLNDLVEEDIASNKFVTAMYCIWNAPSQSLRISNAGHDPLYVYRAATGEMEQHDTEGLPLGIFRGSEYVTESIQLAAGDVLFLYTDGIPEALNGEGEAFGFDRLKEAFKENVNGGAEEIVLGVKKAIETFVGETLQHDDLTLAILKVR